MVNLRVAETEVSGTKIWKDQDESARPSSITVKLLQNGKEIDSKEVSAEDNWKYEFEGLNKYDENGLQYNYTIDEVKVPPGCKKSISDDGLTITNTYMSQVDSSQDSNPEDPKDSNESTP
ncbi:Cna B-type domain-containing protein [Senegalia massiliensis]|uniref:Cna B-type domain-containing protein n=1 Tax=Senegalia massiliensis TaxID=1720316 RepID=UPI003BF784D7